MPKPCRRCSLMDDQILKHENESSFSGADSDQQVNHPDNLVRAAQNKNAPARGLLKQEPQTAHLLVAVWNEIALLGKEFEKQLDQLGQVVKRRRFYAQAFDHVYLIPQEPIAMQLR